MRLGITLPLVDIQGDPATVRDFAQAAEGMGYHHLAAPDHVLGVNVASRPDWGARNTSKDCFHDPFVLFGFLSACTRTIEFSTRVMILPQRQTALVAKQAASLDVLSGGRFRFGIGIGWNPVEYVGLNESFKDRGKRSEEQVQVMRALWAEPSPMPSSQSCAATSNKPAVIRPRSAWRCGSRPARAGRRTGASSSRPGRTRA
jgi:alkanesulfonate monooxygenase SsuD/methylene tetrahydromethanopterin reductase-like flavin-dependent oxidoreductase (luciferase family)